MNMQTNMQEPLVPNVSAPSIASSAMLVDLHITSWTARKRDKNASAEIAASKGAKEKATRLYKDMLADCEELSVINKFITRIRENTHRFMTLPWSDGGTRLLTTAQYFDYHNIMTQAKAEFEGYVDAFCDVYDDAVIEARLTLKDLYNPADYPPTEEVRKKFSFVLAYTPVPSAGDFRVDIGTQANNELREQFERASRDRINMAMMDMWKRLHTALKHMSEKLDSPTGKSDKRFHATLVPNMLDLIDVMGKCNITGDSQMTAIQHQLESTFRGITTDALKEDAFLRASTKSEVDNVLATINSLPSLDF